MTDLSTIFSEITTEDASVLYSPAYRQRVRAAGRLVALTYLEETATLGDILVNQLADAARAIPGDFAGYPLLHGMEAAGLVTASTHERSPRRMYEITMAGRDAATALRACLAATVPGNCLTEYVNAA